MTWKAGLSRYLPVVRFFACPDSPSSAGVRKWFMTNYEELKHLNPNLPLLLRTTENCMPAVLTDLEWTKNDVLRFMIQTGRFRNPNGTIAADRVEAAKAYLKTDWNAMQASRFVVPGFDPVRPNIDEISPGWRDDPNIGGQLTTFLQMEAAVREQEAVFQSGPDLEYTRAVNALLMAQRVDLWCAGEKEVVMALQHLYKLGRALNERETCFPPHIQEFYPGIEDI